MVNYENRYAIKKLREGRGFSQQVVADHLGMNQATYHKMESDKTDVKLEQLERLAELYDMSLIDLITSDRRAMHIETNHGTPNGVVIGDPELVKNLLDAKDELIKLKDEKIAWLEEKIKLLTE